LHLAREAPWFIMRLAGQAQYRRSRLNSNVRRRKHHRGRAMLIRGSCHCGNVSFRLDWQPEPTEIPARACSYSFCVKHGGVWTSCPTGSLLVEVKDFSRVSKYSFGTGTADFHVCSSCGAVPVVTSEIGGRTYAVVSVNAMDDVSPSLLKRAPVSFEGEDEPARLARRARGWIPDVRFAERDA
jgi:hypothetical protein